MICAALAVFALLGAPSTPAKAKAPPPKAAATKSAETYSRWIEDLPVMPGLSETDGGYSFEVAQGYRIAEARMHGVTSGEVVRGFYASTLEALGWKPDAGQPYLYRRGRERLIFHVDAAKPKGVLAVFVLSPRANPTGATPGGATPGGDAPSGPTSARP